MTSGGAPTNEAQSAVSCNALANPTVITVVGVGVEFGILAGVQIVVNCCHVFASLGLDGVGVEFVWW